VLLQSLLAEVSAQLAENVPETNRVVIRSNIEPTKRTVAVKIDKKKVIGEPGLNQKVLDNMWLKN
jgi:hypothetical protein